MTRRKAPWSLQRRITWLFWLLSTIPVAIATLIGVSYLSKSVFNELEALMHEEIEEARSAIRATTEPITSFTTTASAFGFAHPETRMAWRFYRTANGSPAGDFGETTLLTRLAPGLPQATDHPTTSDLGDSVLCATTRISDVLTVTLVLDGSVRMARIRNYWLVGLGTAGLSLLFSIIAARFLAWRFRSLLKDIADRLRLGDSHRREGSSLPIELAPIANELEAMLNNVRLRASEAKLFTAGLAHELRSPLQNLIGEAEVAMLRDRTPEQYQTLLQRQAGELHEFARSIDNLLYLCSATEPVPTPPTETFDLAEEMAVRLQTERGQARAHGVTIAVEDNGDTKLDADREAVVRAVRNLVNNAIKWSKSGDTVRLSLHGDGPNLTIEVHDAGPGIALADRQRVFTPFAKGAVPSGERAGFGLGLAMIQTTATQHRGTITIEDSPDGGALLRLVLPRQQGPLEDPA